MSNVECPMTKEEEKEHRRSSRVRRGKSLAPQCLLLASDGSSGRSLKGARRQIAAGEPLRPHAHASPDLSSLDIRHWAFDIGHAGTAHDSARRGKQVRSWFRLVHRRGNTAIRCDTGIRLPAGRGAGAAPLGNVCRFRVSNVQRRMSNDQGRGEGTQKEQPREAWEEPGTAVPAAGQRRFVGSVAKGGTTTDCSWRTAPTTRPRVA